MVITAGRESQNSKAGGEGLIDDLPKRVFSEGNTDLR